MDTICGADCTGCGYLNECSGCAISGGKPFGEKCMIAECCLNSGYENCSSCTRGSCTLKKQLISEFNALGIPDMEEVTELYALRGQFVNLAYNMQSGQTVRLWDDNKMYLGNQICKKDSSRCYGLTADENYLLVCEYGESGSDPEIIVYKKRKFGGK